MTSSRTLIAFVSAIGIAFLFGYDGGRWFISLKGSFQKSAPTSSLPLKASTQPVPALPSEAPLPVSNAPKNPPQLAIENPPTLPTVAPNLDGSRNPVPGSQTFMNTLESVQPTELSEELKQQRNVYFERLQQQIQEMRSNSSPPSASDPTPPSPDPAPFNQETGNANAFPVIEGRANQKDKDTITVDEDEEDDEGDSTADSVDEADEEE